MAEELQKPEARETVAQVEEVVVVTDDVRPTEKTAMPSVYEEAPVPLPETETESCKNEDAVIEKSPDSGSFKEESTRVADLPDNEKKALDELKQLVQEALNKHEFSAETSKDVAPSKEEEEEEKKKAVAVAVVVVAEEEEKKKKEEPANPEPENVAQEEKDIEVIEGKKAADVAEDADDDGAKTVEAIEETIVAVSSVTQEPKPEAETEPAPVSSEQDSKEAKPEPDRAHEEVSIWGIPLLTDDRSDVILLKFLRARDFKVKEALTMLKNTIRWRKEFGIDELINQDLGDDLDRAVFMHGFDKEGHPVCYNVYGEFQRKDLYQTTFSDEEKRQRFLRWRVQFLERSIRKLDLRPGGVSTIVQVNDLKNSPGPAKWELRQATKQALHLLQDNYPEFVAKQVFINVPWWYLAVNKMISPFFTQRTRSKFVFAGPSKSADTLLRYITAEQLPVKFGGLSKEGENEFAAIDAAIEITVKPAAKHTVEFPVTEACHLSWEVRVVGWEVSYGAEFVPSAEGGYSVIIQKAKKLNPNAEEPVVSDSFKISEPGKVVITIDNPTSKKKKLLYRLKTKSSSGHRSFRDELCSA